MKATLNQRIQSTTWLFDTFRLSTFVPLSILCCVFSASYLSPPTIHLWLCIVPYTFRIHICIFSYIFVVCSLYSLMVSHNLIWESTSIFCLGTELAIHLISTMIEECHMIVYTQTSTKRGCFYDIFMACSSKVA